MPKVNVYSLNRPESKVTEVAVEDDSNPGVVLNFVFKQPDIPLAIRIDSEVSKYDNFYSGVGLPEKPPLPLAGGKVIDYTLELCQIICTILVLQDMPEEDKYSFEELMVISSTMPKAFAKLIMATKDLMADFQEFFENPTEAVATPQSELMSAITEDTLN